jgi:hypothetical protein
MDQHFILTLGRSGSNALVDIINQHPHAINYGELLGDWNTIRKWQGHLGLWRGQDATYLDRLLADGAPLRVINSLRSLRKIAAGKRAEVRCHREIRTVGAKDFTNLFVQTPALHDYFRDRPDIKVIGLYRSDIVARFISWQLLDRTGTIKRGVGDKAIAARITLDTDTLLADLTTVATEAAQLDGMLDALPASQVFRIRYEAFFFDSAAMHDTVQQMFSFLNLPPYPIRMRSRKINSRRLRETVVNYDACLAALAGTLFEDDFRRAG